MDIVMRVASIYVFVLLALRVMGKRELSQLSANELVTLMLIPEIVSGALSGDNSLVSSLVGVATLLTLVFVISLLSYRYKTFEKVMTGEPVILVRDGRLVRENLHPERIPPEEIMAEMRKVGIERLDQVKWGILEADGKLSFVTVSSDAAHRSSDNAHDQQV